MILSTENVYGKINNQYSYKIFDKFSLILFKSIDQTIIISKTNYSSSIFHLPFCVKYNTFIFY